MKTGTFYGIGVGPGDPDLLTIKAAKILATCPHIFVPKAKMKADSVALEIAQKHIDPSSQIHEQVFPMVPDKEVLSAHWRMAAEEIAAILRAGEDACFLTLGDSLVYSTYIYLLRELKIILPEVTAITIPGITSFNAVAALTHFPLGEGKEPIRVIPTADDLAPVQKAFEEPGTVVLMKIGDRLQTILTMLEEKHLIGNAVFVARAGHEKQQIETDLRKLKGSDAKAGYLSVILVHVDAKGENK